MKFLIASLGVFFTSQMVSAAEVLVNCYSEEKAEFFAGELEEIAKEKRTPILLLNSKKEVVGVISTSPKRQNGKAKIVSVGKLSLCSSLEADDFYYSKGNASDLMKWVNAGSIEITQDEGLIELNASVVKKKSYATLYKVTFKAYDVFGEEASEFEGQPDYKEDWGIPKGRGEFYFYAPSSWGK